MGNEKERSEEMGNEEVCAHFDNLVYNLTSTHPASR